MSASRHRRAMHRDHQRPPRPGGRFSWLGSKGGPGAGVPVGLHAHDRDLHLRPPVLLAHERVVVRQRPRHADLAQARLGIRRQPVTQRIDVPIVGLLGVIPAPAQREHQHLGLVAHGDVLLGRARLAQLGRAVEKRHGPFPRAGLGILAFSAGLARVVGLDRRGHGNPAALDVPEQRPERRVLPARQAEEPVGMVLPRHLGPADGRIPLEIDRAGWGRRRVALRQGRINHAGVEAVGGERRAVLGPSLLLADPGGQVAAHANHRGIGPGLDARGTLRHRDRPGRAEGGGVGGRVYPGARGQEEQGHQRGSDEVHERLLRDRLPSAECPRRIRDDNALTRRSVGVRRAGRRNYTGMGRD